LVYCAQVLDRVRRREGEKSLRGRVKSSPGGWEASNVLSTAWCTRALLGVRARTLLAAPVRVSTAYVDCDFWESGLGSRAVGYHGTAVGVAWWGSLTAAGSASALRPRRLGARRVGPGGPLDRMVDTVIQFRVLGSQIHGNWKHNVSS